MPGFRQLVPLVQKLAQPNVHPAGDRERKKTAPVLPLLDGCQRLPPIAGSIPQMPLSQVEIGQGAKDMGCQNLKSRGVVEIKRLEVTFLRFLPASIPAVGIPKRPIDPGSKMILFRQSPQRPVSQGLCPRQIILKAGNK